MGNPVSPNYYDDFLAGLLAMKDPGSGEAVYGPTRQAEARSKASDAETARFTSFLGGSRKMKEGERQPQGSYALAKYPSIDMDLWIAEAGGVPRGHSIFSFMGETPQEEQERRRKQMEWAQHQRKLLGMGGY